MSIRSALIGLMLGCAASAAYAQTAPSPADVGIDKQSPNVFKLLDTSKTWTPFGTVNEHTHIFSPATNGPIPSGNCIKWGPGIQDAGMSCGTGTGTPAFSEADLMVTDPAVGMASGGADNAPFVPALMDAIQAPSGNFAGYDVLFPGVHGQSFTDYYFSDTFDMTRGGNYHCSGTTGPPSVRLIFAPGVDGILENSYNMTGNNVGAAGMISGCGILSLGSGTANGSTVTNANVLTGVTFSSFYSTVPKPTWQIGDAIILSPSSQGYYPIESIFTVPIGTTVTAVDGTTGDITLSNPVTPYLGWTGGTKATAVFTETGSNNFVAGDTFQVGVITYTFGAALSDIHYVRLGPDFATSAANLVAAIMGTLGEGSAYLPDVNARGANPDITAALSGNKITFTTRFSGPVVNTYPSIYTAAGTSAGSFGAAHFAGANDASNCASPCTVQAGNLLTFFQLPKSKAFKVQTTVGSNTVTVISGPRLLQGGDVVWSDAFPFGSTVWTYSDPSATTFPQTIQMAGAANSGPTLNATVTHAVGAEGDLWIMPAAEHRRTIMSSEHNQLSGWPIGLNMACSNGAGLNCDGSHDRAVAHSTNFVGRWASGNNYSTSSSINEEYSHNFFADVWEGGELGEIYTNLDSEGPESGGGWGILKNCSNQNYTTIFGTYNGGVYCVGGDDLVHPYHAGPMPLIIGPLAGPSGAPSLSGNGFSGPFTFGGGYDNAMCTQLGDGLGGRAFAFSYYQCATGDTWSLNWDPTARYWSLGLTGNGEAMEFIGDQGYPGYDGAGPMVNFARGFELGNGGNYVGADRMVDSGATAPGETWRLQGDARFNQMPLSGGNLAWTNINLAGGVQLTAPVTASVTTTLTVNVCPSPAPPVGTPVIAQYNAVTLDQVLGMFASCTGTTLTLQAASAFNAAGDRTLIFTQWRPAGKVANDAAGTSWPVGTLTYIASLAPCAGDASIGLGVVADGQTVGAAGYNAAIGAGGGGTRRLVFCDGTSWTYH